jgi:hypothetical protein
VSEAATKSRIYVDPRECTSEEWREVRQHEFEKLCKHGAIETVRPTKEQLEGAVIIPLREVDEIKDYGRRKKARFATRGDLERRWRQTRGLEDVDASSPTATPEEDRAVQHLAACRNWPMVGFDIPEAYTQQDPKLWERRLKERGVVRAFYRPPKSLLEGLGQHPSTLWIAHKALYGVDDAGLLWYKTMKADFATSDVGGTRCESCQTSPCIFRWIEKESGKVLGACSMVVDDGKLTGSEEFVGKVIIWLGEKYGIAGDKFEYNTFENCGIRFRREEAVVVASQSHCSNGAEVKPDPPYDERMEDIRPEDTTRIRSTNGSIAWKAMRTRPELCFGVSDVASYVTEAQGVTRVNKAWKRAQTERELRFVPIPGKQVMYAYSDAAWANMRGFASQGGYAIFMAEESDQDKVVANLVSWKSQRIRRVCRSTFAAECLQAVATRDAMSWVHPLFEFTMGESIPLYLILDANSLVEAIKAENPGMTEKRLRLDVLSLHNGLERGEYRVTWTDSACQYADELTKLVADDKSLLVEFVASNRLRKSDKVIGYRKQAAPTDAQVQLLRLLDCGLMSDVAG